MPLYVTHFFIFASFCQNCNHCADSEAQVLLDNDTTADEQYEFIGDNYGVTGTGGPWYIWVIIGVAMLALIVCFVACRCHYKKKNKVAQENVEQDDKALDQPLRA